MVHAGADTFFEPCHVMPAPQFIAGAAIGSDRRKTEFLMKFPAFFIGDGVPRVRMTVSQIG